MSDLNSDDFKFGLDQENPDDLLHASSEDSRIAKLSKRITVLAIIIPCLIGIALFFLYLDLKGRVIQNQTSGNQSFEVLSQDFDVRIQDISAKLAQLEAGISEKSASADTRFEELKNQIGNLISGLKKTDSLLKKTIETDSADKKERVNQEEKLSALSAQLTAHDAEWDGRVDKLAGNFSQLEAEITQYRQEIEKFRQDIGELNTLVDAKIDRRTLLLEIDKLQQKVTVLSGDIEKKLISIRSDFRRLDNDLKQTRQSFRQSAATAPSSLPSPGQGPSPDTGKILEQNLE